MIVQQPAGNIKEKSLCGYELKLVDSQYCIWLHDLVKGRQDLGFDRAVYC